LSPSRFIGFFEDFPNCAEGGADILRLAALADKHVTTLIPDWVPALEAKYKVRLLRGWSYFQSEAPRGITQPEEGATIATAQRRYTLPALPRA